MVFQETRLVRSLFEVILVFAMLEGPWLQLYQHSLLDLLHIMSCREGVGIAASHMCNCQGFCCMWGVCARLCAWHMCEKGCVLVEGKRVGAYEHPLV